jgi:hypothetical protein
MCKSVSQGRCLFAEHTDIKICSLALQGLKKISLLSVRGRQFKVRQVAAG